MDIFSRKPAPAAPAAKSGDGLVTDATTQTFAIEVIEASKSKLVLVDFWADWCGPCRQLTPILEKVVRSYGGRVKLVKVNVDQNQPLAAQLRIQSLPTVYAFADGRPIDGFMGAQTESQVRALVDRLLGGEGSDIDQALAAAEQALAAGDLQAAAETYAAILQEEQRPEAFAGLARCYMKSGDIDRARQTIEMVPPEHKQHATVASVRAQLELADQAAKSGPFDELVAKSAASPNDHQARIDLALAAAAKGDKDRAVEELIELFRRNRTWNEDAARKQLVKLFEAWGPKDPATIEGRRRLSSLMFS